MLVAVASWLMLGPLLLPVPAPVAAATAAQVQQPREAERPRAAPLKRKDPNP
jgi:hypothetical protein